MVSKDEIEIRFFLFKDLNSKENNGIIDMRTNEIEKIYPNFLDNGVKIYPNEKLEDKIWSQK